MFKLSWIALLMTACLNTGRSQIIADTQHILTKTVSIHIQSVPLDRVFDLLSKQTGCYFTYDAELVDGNRPISIKLSNIVLKKALDTLLQDPKLSYQTINNQIVIHPIWTITKAKGDTLTHLTLSGRVVDAITNEGLGFASVTIKHSYFGGITNENGYFTLKIPVENINDSITFSYIGYYNVDMAILNWQPQCNVPLKMGMVSIQEVVVRSYQAHEIVNRAVDRLTENFYCQSYCFEAFYRESVEKNNKYMVYSEALINGFKPPFNTETVPKVQLQKARKFSNFDQSDTLLVKLRGGMEACFQLDLAYQLHDFFSTTGLALYHYSLNDIVIWHNVMAYAINFKPQRVSSDPQYEGTLFIAVNGYAVLGIEFYLTKEFLNQSKNLFVVRKTKQINVQPISARYTVHYQEWNGKYFSKYVRGDLSLKVRKRRQFFPHNYNMQLEMVYTHADTIKVFKRERKNLLATHTIFSDSEYQYDSEFWVNDNVINPENDIIEAFRKSGFKLHEQNGAIP